MPIANPTLWFCWLCGGELMLCVLCAVHIVDHGSVHNGRRWLIASRRCQDHWARVSSPACSGSNTFSNLSSIFGGSDDFLLASVGLARTMNHLPSVFIITEDALPWSWGTSPSESPFTRSHFPVKLHVTAVRFGPIGRSPTWGRYGLFNITTHVFFLWQGLLAQLNSKLGRLHSEVFLKKSFHSEVFLKK